jgi:exopolyphosphatase/guanosine-5'-triphosphate,3'-diphosphate pyrophosphatase
MSDIPVSKPPATLAAVDLGSNSFHMIVARVADGQIQVIDRLKEMVRLGEGLTEEKTLQPEVAERALACLERFGQRVRAMPQGSVRAVGTNTLRQLRGGNGFVVRAEAALGHPIEIIAGREEARLVYLGVAHGLAAGDSKRLVVDIGGGSTELIVGQSFSPKLRESLHMGCVSMTRRAFADGRITAKAMEKAELRGALEILPVRELFRNAGWQTAVGSSGTIKAIRDVVTAQGWSEDDISAKSLERLAKALVKFGHIDAIDLKGLSEQRRPVFTGGVAVLYAVFRNLGVERMEVSDEALREGLLYEMTGRGSPQDDVRERTVDSLVSRYHVDSSHARRIENTAMSLFGQVVKPWALDNPQYPMMLSWASRLHEIGLNVSHSQYQKHGAYLICNSDLSGFSLSEQAVLAALVRGHRRKFANEVFDALPEEVRQSTRRLCVLLRLAVLVHRGRSASGKPMLLLEADNDDVRVSLPTDWLENHPLTRAELEEEAQRLQAAGYRMRLS